MLLRRVLLIMVCAMMAGCATRMPVAKVRDLSHEAFEPINAFRREHGLGPVHVDEAVAQAAELQAIAMASTGTLSHEVGGSFDHRMKQAGFHKFAAVENVGAGDATTSEAIERWKRSAGHRSNLLMPNATRFGMVRAEATGARYKGYWALIMVGR